MGLCYVPFFENTVIEYLALFRAVLGHLALSINFLPLVTPIFALFVFALAFGRIGFGFIRR